MKRTFLPRLILLFLALTGFTTVVAQHALTASQLATARKKADAETTMYRKKGFRVAHSSKDMHTLIENFYKDVYRENKPGERVYLWAMGTGKASSQAGAEEQALHQAKKHFPGLILMYFNSWISTNKNLSEGDKKLLTQAINNAKNSISGKIMAMLPDKQLTFVKEKKGQYQAAVRVLYKQFPLRELARKEIKKQLRKTTSWPESKMDRLLHFDH